MPRIKTGRRILIKTLSAIMENPETSINQKLEACKILAGLQSKPVPKPKEEPKPGKHPKSGLLH